MNDCLPFAIIDLDNCLCDDRWRRSLIDESATNPDQRFARYHAAARLDLPGSQQYATLKNLRQYHRFLIFTARPEAIRDETTEWLQQWHIQYHRLFMRADGDHSSSVEVKRAMLKDVQRLGYAPIVVAVDDRADILDMYREEGVPAVFELSIHPDAPKEIPQ